MARLPRLHAPDAVQYIVQRVAAGRVLFTDADDVALLIRLVGEACRQHGFALHAYALTPSHLHLLGTPSGPKASAAVLQAIGRTFVPWLNRKVERPGALWQRRYRSTIIDPDLLLPVMHVVETRAEQVGEGATFLSASSRAHHVGVRQDGLVTDHARYWALSDTPFERQAIYRRLCMSPPEPAFVKRVEDAVDHGWALGSPPFLIALGEATNRRAVPLGRGRPRKPIVMSPINREQRSG